MSAQRTASASRDATGDAASASRGTSRARGSLGTPRPSPAPPRGARRADAAPIRGVRRADKAIALYVHIPFCASRCPYCDFATAPARSPLRARYLDALAGEIRREGALLGRPRVRTLYVGGGTPSLLDPEEISALARELGGAFALRLEEATAEVNPATLDRGRLEGWRALGITRLSVGAQSFEARGLRALGRTHRPEDSATAVAAARSVGLDVSLDLIFGWPGQSKDLWRDDLAAALALAPDHLSCYPLELAMEPDEAVANWPGGGWPSLRRWRERSAAAAPGEDDVASWYEVAERTLAAAGFRHYEIANWARPGKRCLHNLTYWRNEEWLGVGAGAHSQLGGVRSRNPGGLIPYIAAIDAKAPRIVDEGADPAVDGAMLALRLDDGLDLDGYADRFGEAAAARVRGALRSLDGTRLVRWTGGRATLTPRGRLLASEVFVRLLADDVTTMTSGSLASG